jgi:hypothetical protein
MYMIDTNVVMLYDWIMLCDIPNLALHDAWKAFLFSVLF